MLLTYGERSCGVRNRSCSIKTCRAPSELVHDGISQAKELGTYLIVTARRIIIRPTKIMAIKTPPIMYILSLGASGKKKFNCTSGSEISGQTCQPITFANRDTSGQGISCAACTEIEYTKLKYNSDIQLISHVYF